METLRLIALSQFNLGDKEVKEKESKIKEIREQELKLSLEDEKIIELRAQRRCIKEQLEYFKGVKVASEIILKSIEIETKTSEIAITTNA